MGSPGVQGRALLVVCERLAPIVKHSVDQIRRDVLQDLVMATADPGVPAQDPVRLRLADAQLLRYTVYRALRDPRTPR